MSAAKKLTRCGQVAPMLVFYVCDEVSAAEREQIEAHLSSCEPCALQLAEEKELHEAFAVALEPAETLDPSGLLLSQCRSELSEALDDLSAPPVRERWQPFGWLRRWMALRPAWSAAMLVMFGLLFGTQLASWLPSWDGEPAKNNRAVNVLAAPRVTDEQLENMTLAGINFSPSADAAPGTVQLQLRAEQPLVVSGNLDDSDILRILTFVVKNGERFDAGMRLDCLDALRDRVRDEDVRRVLLIAARKDHNPAVRIKALEFLRDSVAEESVREVLLDALRQDDNPGVRVEAINLLVHSLTDASISDTTDSAAPEAAVASSDPSAERVIRTLEELRRHDSSRCVRQRSAAALRQISSRDVQ